jgi:L-threonylcarbamoyladenylate synthase
MRYAAADNTRNACVSTESENLAAAVAALRAGGIVLHPTEAVWGLACDPFGQAAVARVFALKQRPSEKGLILVADDPDRLAPLLADVPAEKMRAARATWPGPHTWVIPAGPRCPSWLSGERGSLAVRVSAHPLVRALAAAFGGPLVSTSANRSGEPAPRCLHEVDPAIRAAVDAMVEGETGGLDRPTPVRDILTGEVFRD